MTTTKIDLSSGEQVQGTLPAANGGTGNTTGQAASCSGNAATATTLATACSVQTNLASTAAPTFNGSSNITPGVTGVLPVTNGGTGATTAAAALTNLTAVGGSNDGTAQSLTLWIGTTAQYNSLGSYSATTVYVCT
jgi:hypothetical protein